ncbi:MAG TPA: hypothetical protein VFE85_07035 [Woeseiaceae bacterium]|nr:hypothetical protein [Woeseiaceae bacterium]
MSHNKVSVWLPRVLFESMLIVVSILLALALDEWRDNRENEEMVDRAMATFLIEIAQNKARVDDSAPFNNGLREVLTRRYEHGGIETIDEFVSMVESYSPGVLQSSAWDTALATGALSKMNYDLVSALSLTYSLQNRYQQAVRNGIEELTSPQNLSTEKLDLAVFNSIRYLTEVTRMEAELGVVYDEASSVIREARQQDRGVTVLSGGEQLAAPPERAAAAQPDR